MNDLHHHSFDKGPVSPTEEDFSNNLCETKSNLSMDFIQSVDEATEEEL